jgi:hypothetical protein
MGGKKYKILAGKVGRPRFGSLQRYRFPHSHHAQITGGRELLPEDKAGTAST